MIANRSGSYRNRTGVAYRALLPDVPACNPSVASHLNTGRMTFSGGTMVNRVTDANERAAAAAMDHLLAPLRSKDAV